MPELVRINYASFLDALEIAHNRGSRIRMSDGPLFEEFCLGHNINLPHVFMFAQQQLTIPKLAVIKDGLMEGLYVYSLDDAVSYAYLDFDASYVPLDTYGGDLVHDVVLSYGTADLPLCRDIRDLLQAAGLATYIVDVTKDPKDPMWPIRFREAMFFSKYLVLLLTESYLTGRGACLEVFDGARFTVAHRRNTFFYPMMLLVEDVSKIGNIDWARKHPVLRRLAPDSFEWIRDHVFPIGLNLGTEWLTKFLTSLVRNSNGDFDAGFLECLGPQLRAIELHRFTAEDLRSVGDEPPEHVLGPDGELRSATVFIEHPSLTLYTLVINPCAGITKFMGVNEPNPDALDARKLADPVQTIIQHFQPHLRANGKPSHRRFIPCPNCGFKTISQEDLLSATRPEDISGAASRMKCKNCGEKVCYVCAEKPFGRFVCPACQSSTFTRW